MQIYAHDWQEVGALKAVQGMQQKGTDVISGGSNTEHNGRFCGFFLFQYILNFFKFIHFALLRAGK